MSESETKQTYDDRRSGRTRGYDESHAGRRKFRRIRSEARRIARSSTDPHLGSARTRAFSQRNWRDFIPTDLKDKDLANRMRTPKP